MVGEARIGNFISLSVLDAGKKRDEIDKES
jgi:hypothetical protein